MEIHLDAQEIRRIGKRLGCGTDTQLAAHLGLGRSTLYRAINGKGFNSGTLAALLAAGADLKKLVVR